MPLQLCLKEPRFNRFYYLLIKRLIEFDPANYRYSVKYALWDWLKGLNRLEVHEVRNLATITSLLLQSEAIPLHFLKVLEFDELGKNDSLVLYLLLE